jgi:acetylornithine/succinyldiaminopimelate/putrescine aminotransferase
MDVFRPGDHGSTFGGNPLACAAAYAVTRHVIEEGLSQHAGEMGERLRIGLEAVKARHETVIKEVRGMGLLMAVEFHENIGAGVVGACNETGLLLNPVRPNAVRFMPPLTVSPAEVDEALERFDRGVQQASGA